MLKDTALVQIRVRILGYTPLGVEQVQKVLHVEAELESIGCLADLNLGIVLVAEIYSVNPWRIYAVCFSIFTLVLAEILVVVNILHEAVTVVVRNKRNCLSATSLSVGIYNASYA